MRYIDADKLKKHYAWWNNEEQKTFDEIVDAQPTADIWKNIKAFWKRNKANTVQCTHCKCCWVDHIGLFDNFNFCPNCGADMRGGNE